MGASAQDGVFVVKFRIRRGRKPVRLSALQLQGGPVALQVQGPFPEIRHVIEHKPRPRPTVIQPIVYNQEGQEFRTVPINCDGRYAVPVYFPLSWLSGNPSDAQQCSIRLELRYTDPF